MKLSFNSLLSRSRRDPPIDGDEGLSSLDVLVELGYDVGALLVVFGLFVVTGGRTVNRAIRPSAAHVSRVDEAVLIRCPSS